MTLTTMALMELPPRMSIERTRAAAGGRGRGWVYERIAAGDFETILDGSRRLVVTESFLKWLDTKRAEARIARDRATSSDEVL